MSEGADRRQYPRLDTDCPVRYRVIPGIRAEFQGAHLRDYSVGGVRFRTLNFLPRGARMLLELQLPEAPPVRTVGRAAWVRILPGGSGFEVGGQFEMPDLSGPEAEGGRPEPHGNG